MKILNDKSRTKRHRYQHIDARPLELEDITAVAHSVLDIEGYQAAYEFICGWKPKSIHYKIAIRLLDRLLLSGKVVTVEEFLDSGCIQSLGHHCSNTLALVGHDIDCASLEKSLCNKDVLKYCDLKELEGTPLKAQTVLAAELLLSGCEILAANGVTYPQLSQSLNIYALRIGGWLITS